MDNLSQGEIRKLQKSIPTRRSIQNMIPTQANIKYPVHKPRTTYNISALTFEKSGGILVIWDSRVVKGKEVVLGNFSVSVLLEEVGGSEEWWFSGVYGPCNAKDRDDFWVELAGLYGLCGKKWCVGGDFNVVRHPSEKLNGDNYTKSMRRFDQLIRDMGLKDPQLFNAEYTWSNMRDRLACSRIDRFLTMEEWESMFEEVRQEGLVRTTSDHCPISINTNRFQWGPSPFRFENMWLTHKKFNENWKQWWGKYEIEGWAGFRFMGKLKMMKEELKKWNKEEFGDVRIEKKAIMKRIEEIDKEDGKQNIGEEERVERRKLKRRLEELIIREEISWNQKAKVNGVKEWDNNSKMFHRIASGRKTNNLINKLEGRDGRILHTEEEIEKEIIEFFEDLFKEKEMISNGIEGLEWANIDMDRKLKLEEPFQEKEIKEALFECAGDKAPGPDGFSMAALKEGWEVIKEDLMKVGSNGFSIGAVTMPNMLSLVIGPGAGYNLKSNPLPEEDKVSSQRSVESRQNEFQEQLRAEHESFRAVFDRRRQQIGRLDLDEE